MAVALVAPPPALMAGEVALRPIDGMVAPLLLAASLDPEVTRWTQIPDDLTMSDAGMVTAGWSLPSDRIARFQVCLPSLSPAGMVSVWLDRHDVAEVGYWLLAPARGRGVATVAVTAICDWAFRDCGFDRLQLTTLPGNLASESVARKCGFTRVGSISRDIKGDARTLTLWTRHHLAGPTD